MIFTNRVLFVFLTAFFSSFFSFSQVQMVSPLAGGEGPLDGVGLNAFLLGPWQAVRKDSMVYFGDYEGGYLRSLNTKTKKVTTLRTGLPKISAMALSHGGDSLFFSIADSVIMRYRISTKVLTQLVVLPDNEIDAMACDRKGRLFIGGGGHRVLFRDSIGTIRSIAGRFNVSGNVDGPDSLARFNRIAGLALSRTEDTLYIADRFNSRIRRLIRPTRVVNTIPNVPVFGPRQIAFNRNRDTLVIANSSGHTIVRHFPKTNSSAAWCGGSLVQDYIDGPANTARFRYPNGVVPSDSGWLVCDFSNRRFRAISGNGRVRTFAGIGVIGDGIDTNSRFFTPYDAVQLMNRDSIFIADQGNHAIRIYNIQNKTIRTLAGSGYPGNVQGLRDKAWLNRPSNLAIVPTGDTLFFTEPFANKVKMLLVRTGEVRWLAGSDTSGFADRSVGRFARFNRPQDLAYRDGKLYVADVLNHRIRLIDVRTTAVSTYAGSTSGFKDSTLLQSRFNRPFSVEFAGKYLFVGEDGGLRIRRIDPDSGLVKVWAGSGNLGSIDGIGTAARFRGIQKLNFDPVRNRLFVSGFQNEGIIRSVGVDFPLVETYTNANGYANGFLSEARFTGPMGIFTDSIRNRYVIAETNTNRIRTINWYWNMPPKAKIDTLLVLREDTTIALSNFARNMNSGGTIGDTLQTWSFIVGQHPKIQQASLSATGLFNLTLSPDSNGIVDLPIVMKDNGGRVGKGIDSTLYFTRLVILSVNDAPSFSILGGDTASNQAFRRKAGFIVSKSAGPPNESDQSLQFQIRVNKPGYFLTAPYVENDTLKYLPHPDSIGLVQAQIRVLDNGGTLRNGVDSSAFVSFPILLFDPVQVSQLKGGGVVAFPNPASEQLFFINLPIGVSRMQWINPQGKTVAESEVKHENGFSQVEVPNGLKGLFLLKPDMGQAVHRIMVVK